MSAPTLTASKWDNKKLGWVVPRPIYRVWWLTSGLGVEEKYVVADNKAIEDARNLLRSRGVSFKANFYTLNPSDVSQLLEVADMMHYQKPKNANGSRGRYFFAYLKSARGE